MSPFYLDSYFGSAIVAATEKELMTIVKNLPKKAMAVRFAMPYLRRKMSYSGHSPGRVYQPQCNVFTA